MEKKHSKWCNVRELAAATYIIHYNYCIRPQPVSGAAHQLQQHPEPLAFLSACRCLPLFALINK
eukprot:4286326-Amphidinium_carterae.1